MVEEQRYRDPDTGENYYINGSGLFDVVKNVGSKLASKLTGKTAKKLAAKATEKGSEKIGEKTGQLIGDKIYNKFSNKPTDETKGDEIINLLHQGNAEQPSQDTDKYKYIKEVYNDLLL